MVVDQNPRRFYLRCVRDWLTLVTINTFIAIFLTLVDQGSFWVNLIYSQSIGISIASLVGGLVLRHKKAAPHPFHFLMAIVGGVMIGLAVGTLLTGAAPPSGQKSSNLLSYSFIYSIMIGCVVVYFFYSRGRQEHLNNELNLEKLKQAEIQQKLTTSNLKMLQAQIEPHFLFNTLSNILGLIDQRPDDAKLMLTNLTDYLRGSLDRTRDTDATLGDELALVSAYLNIQRIRMGDRLQFDITADAALSQLKLPPLIIQPLVENSIQHGIEQTIEGGHIGLVIRANHEHLHIQVTDTGQGMGDTERAGIGLSNIRSRLVSLYDNQAELRLSANSPQGLVVDIKLPLECL